MDRSKWNNMPQCADITPMMSFFFQKSFFFERETSSKKLHKCIRCRVEFSDLQNLHALGRRLRLPLFSGRRNPPSHRFAFFVSPPVSVFFSAFFSFLFFSFFLYLLPLLPLASPVMLFFLPLLFLAFREQRPATAARLQCAPRCAPWFSREPLCVSF